VFLKIVPIPYKNQSLSKLHSSLVKHSTYATKLPQLIPQLILGHITHTPRGLPVKHYSTLPSLFLVFPRHISALRGTF